MPTECHWRVLSQMEDDTPATTVAADRSHTDEEEGAPRPHRHAPYRPRRRDRPGPHPRPRTRPPGPGPARGPGPPVPAPPHRHRTRTPAPLPRRRQDGSSASPPPVLRFLHTDPVNCPSPTGVLPHPGSAHRTGPQVPQAPSDRGFGPHDPTPAHPAPAPSTWPLPIPHRVFNGQDEKSVPTAGTPQSLEALIQVKRLETENPTPFRALEVLTTNHARMRARVSVMGVSDTT